MRDDFKVNLIQLLVLSIIVIAVLVLTPWALYAFLHYARWVGSFWPK